MSLPRFVVLKSTKNDRYLRYRHESDSIQGFVQCSGDEAWSPYAKFEVVKATCDDRLIHLKCCSNNKYLAFWNQQYTWIIAGADQPDENKKELTCTLFKPVFDRDDPLTPPKPKNYNIKIGEWGGYDGDHWSFEVEGGGITKILIQSEEALVAVSFVGQAADGSLVPSLLFGGDGGNKSEIVLDWPKEYLKSIRGTHGTISDSHVITSLEFKTNLGRRIGPYGKKNGVAFNLKLKRGAIVGFHGRSSSFVDAIGIFTRHVDNA